MEACASRRARAVPEIENFLLDLHYCQMELQSIIVQFLTLVGIILSLEKYPAFNFSITLFGSMDVF